eukprot:m.11416 g.11416  ORF g.11416 m.11416 type:complete len:74 (-) comp4438_c0_seq1:132-353(-)
MTLRQRSRTALWKTGNELPKFFSNRFTIFGTCVRSISKIGLTPLRIPKAISEKSVTRFIIRGWTSFHPICHTI